MQTLINHKKMHQYDDILDLPHHVSKTHPPMSASDRAAQFAPFAALTGHYEAVREASRLTEEKAELDENVKVILDRQIQYIREELNAGRKPAVSITYFVPDSRKSGGSYVTAAGYVKKIQEYERMMIMTDGIRIPMDEITGVKLG